MKFIERNLGPIFLIIVLALVALNWSTLGELSGDVKVVTSCRATACGFDR